jgi:hypothetical protein
MSNLFFETNQFFLPAAKSFSRKIVFSLLATVFLPAACAVLFVGQEARAQGKLPPGSYQQTCNFEKVQGSSLSADCHSKNGQSMKTKLQRYYLCNGDISNDNGNLTCNKTGSGFFNYAKIAFEQAAPTFIGRAPKSNNEILSWLDFMHSDPKGFMQDLYIGNMKEKEAVYVLKNYLARDQSAELRKETIDRAFYHATGALSNPADFAAWDAKVKAQKDWYGRILSAETQKMNKNKTARELMIKSAYVVSLGREATKTDMDSWMPRAETYRQIVEANRNWLYSSSGAKDLAGAVASVLQSKTNKKPNEDEVKNAIGQFRPKRLIFMEMQGAMPLIY